MTWYAIILSYSIIKYATIKNIYKKVNNMYENSSTLKSRKFKINTS